jgi:competence protein ComEA
MKSVLYSLFGVIAGFILAGILLLVSRAPSGTPIELQPAPTKAPIVVQVLGGVARPGIYSLPEGARTQDAIDAAGGLTTAADVSTLNLAQKVEDGKQVNIPCKDGACVVGEEPAMDLPNAGDNAAIPPDAGGGDPGGDFGGVPGGDMGGDTGGDGGDTGEFYGELVDVNNATQEELDTLPGIGLVTAQKIIEYRELNGCFFMPEDLLNISGIGQATLDGIRDLITTDYCYEE